MILDKENMFDWNNALLASRASTNVIDLVANRELGESMAMNPHLKIRVSVDTALVSGGSSTLAVVLQGSTDGSTWDTYLTTPAVAKASLVAGFFIEVPWARRPTNAFGKPKQIRLSYTVGTTDFTGGTISAYVALDMQDAEIYPVGVTVQN
jgi:hypothetical protein